jgi:LemA protein
MDNGIVCLLAAGLPALVVVIWLIASYNRLVNLRNLIAESWSDIDTELKRRYDLIPNLVSTVKGYAAHEHAVLEAVTKARAQAVASNGPPDSQAQDENPLIRSLRQLLATAEAYPQLKADRNFLELQKELANTEDRLQAARRFFNGNTREFNVLTESFPTNLVAQLFGISRKEFFEIEDLRERRPVAVEFPETKREPQA